MYSCILFDFDGTLAHTLDHWMGAFRQVLLESGFQLSEEEIIKECFYSSFEKICSRFGLTNIEEFDEKLHRALAEEMLEAKLFPMVKEILLHCDKHQRKVGLVTSGSRRIVPEALERLEISDLFHGLVYAEDVSQMKPHPEPVQKALRQLGHEPHETLFVGDSQADILAGQAAGTATALFLPEVHRRYYCFDSLRGHGPDFVFQHHEELLGHLSALLPQSSGVCKIP